MSLDLCSHEGQKIYTLTQRRFGPSWQKQRIAVLHSQKAWHFWSPVIGICGTQRSCTQYAHQKCEPQPEGCQAAFLTFAPLPFAFTALFFLSFLERLAESLKKCTKHRLGLGHTPHKSTYHILNMNLKIHVVNVLFWCKNKHIENIRSVLISWVLYGMFQEWIAPSGGKTFSLNRLTIIPKETRSFYPILVVWKKWHFESSCCRWVCDNCPSRFRIGPTWNEHDMWQSSKSPKCNLQIVQWRLPLRILLGGQTEYSQAKQRLATWSCGYFVTPPSPLRVSRPALPVQKHRALGYLQITRL